MNDVKCPRCNQRSAPDEPCGKCIWATLTWPITYNVLASADAQLKRSSRITIAYKPDFVPDWVHIRYVPYDKWQIPHQPPTTMRGFGNDLTRVRFALPSLMRVNLPVEKHEHKIPELAAEVVANHPTTDFIGFVLFDSDKSRKFVTQFLSYSLSPAFALNEHRCWIPVELPDGKTKTVQVGFWLTQYRTPVDEGIILAAPGDTSERKPILGLEMTNLHIQISAESSVPGEYKARDVMRDLLHLTDDDFVREPNWRSTFPDWAMKWLGETVNLEVTRVMGQPNRPLNLDSPDWPSKALDHQFAPKPSNWRETLHTKNRRAADSDIPTLLVVYNKGVAIPYEEIDLSSVAVIVEIDEYTSFPRLIKPAPETLG